MRKRQEPETVELQVDSAGFEGVCVSRYDNKVVFTKYTVPGDRISANLYKNKKKFYEAKVNSIIEKSPDRIEPKCKHFGVCGGCSWQSMSYEKQLYWKSTNVKDVFQRIGKVEVPELREIIGAENQFGYRNKMEFSFGASRWLTDDEVSSEIEIERKDYAFGLHIPGRFDKILDIERCEIQSDYANQILSSIKEFTYKHNYITYNARTHDGFLRGLIIRYSAKENSYMTILMTSTPKNEHEKDLITWFGSEFADNFPKITNLIHAINDSVNSVTIKESLILKGEGFFYEDILGVNFRVSPFSFFQTNSFQLNRFINEIISTAEPKKNMVVWDLYCGTGSISLPIASKVQKVIGVELVESSVEDARNNALINSINNAEFYSADLHNKRIPELLQSLDKPDLVIIDPPRSGMNPNLIGHLLNIAPPDLVYVSCNPATQARDCALLAEKYDVISVQPVDMFPHTYHIESMAKLRLRED